ncbi:hypothetical protein BaRGS_00036761 [Batillaria attramentaria]|uniref:Uncharacterized protein n=1 Tax=Batillaria attramentaria TaxID=370345 RepID=A0ABD0JBJ8_9CAEN
MAKQRRAKHGNKVMVLDIERNQCYFRLEGARAAIFDSTSNRQGPPQKNRTLPVPTGNSGFQTPHWGLYLVWSAKITTSVWAKVFMGEGTGWRKWVGGWTGGLGGSGEV